ncbi:Imm50 family immunity protein [Roseisolibacter sp. H3M3-2]|uniref:Imm50 family immunity protein n=1 Tax=Roseisolibacter sp. H3M3-2 TaxID=3031323 RepID=UPI0023DB46AA|nr:Imm50 family immunity protein [Roseisolibacter sp. H3M3-2]MDF1501790.1 Imm50 family immunity protein [Roseisolibacter sp. H3M3-2]
MEQPPVPLLRAERLLAAFGYWPSFHDAEVHRALLDRGSAGERPSITLVVNVFDSTGAVDERGYYDIRVDVLATLRFADVADVELRDHGVQNVLSELGLERQAAGRIAVELGPCYGLHGVFTCASVEVQDVASYARPRVAPPPAAADP